jgi:hypothetical protein
VVQGSDNLDLMTIQLTVVWPGCIDGVNSAVVQAAHMMKLCNHIIESRQIAPDRARSPTFGRYSSTLAVVMIASRNLRPHDCRREFWGGAVCHLVNKLILLV